MLMRYVLAGLGVLATLGLMGVSASMNWSYQQSLGHSAFDAHVFGVGSVVVDIFKVLSPVAFARAISNRKWGTALVAALVFALSFGFGLLSAVGFNAANRGDMTGSRESLTLSLKAAEKDLREADTKLHALPTARPATVIEQALQGVKIDRRWTTSKACEDATATASRDFCKSYFDQTAELATAVEAARLSASVVKLQNEIAQLRSKGAGRDVDPQASLLARLFPWIGTDGVTLGLNLFPALVFEVVAAFGLVMSLGFTMAGQGRKIDAELVAEAPSPRAMPPKRRMVEEAQTLIPMRPLRMATADDGSLIVED